MRVAMPRNCLNVTRISVPFGTGARESSVKTSSDRAQKRYTIHPSSRALSLAMRHARLRKSDNVIGVCKSSICKMFLARSRGEFARLKYVTL